MLLLFELLVCRKLFLLATVVKVCTGEGWSPPGRGKLGRAGAGLQGGCWGSASLPWVTAALRLCSSFLLVAGRVPAAANGSEGSRLPAGS